MRRRTLLSTAGAGLATSLAGCSSDETDAENGDESNDGSADLEVSLEAATAMVDEPVVIAVSVTNSGDAAGSFEDTLTLEGVVDGSVDRELPAVSEPVEIDEVPAGETETAEIETVAFAYADRYEFALENEGVSKSIEVGPALTTPDESFTLEENLRVSVTDVSLENGVFYRYSTGYYYEPDETGLYAPPSGYLLAGFRFEIDNVGTAVAEVPRDAFEISDGDIVEQLPDGAGLSAVETFDGEPFFDVSLDPGASTDAFLLVQYARDDVRDGVGIDYQRDGQGTLPDARFGLEPDGGSELGLPAFELEDVSAPEAVEIGSNPTLEYTVRNTGDAAGTFRGLVERRDGDEWTGWEPVAVDVEAGATESVSVESTNTDVAAIDYRLDPFDEERTVSFRPATRTTGEWFTIPRGLELRVTDYLSTDELVQQYFGETTREPDSGHRFVVVSVDVRRPSSDAPEALNESFGPSDARFTLEIGSDEFGQGMQSDDPYLEPVEGPSVSDVTVDVGATTTAYTYFEVPETLSLDDALVRWEEDEGNAEAEWRL